MRISGCTLSDDLKFEALAELISAPNAAYVKKNQTDLMVPIKDKIKHLSIVNTSIITPKLI